MIQIRLLLPLSFDHFSISAGTVIAVPAEVAQMAVQRGIAARAEPERAVVAPRETRGGKNRPTAT